jgi:hypothetical protein
MKKILSLLSGMSLVATTGASVVACDPPSNAVIDPITLDFNWDATKWGNFDDLVGSIYYQDNSIKFYNQDLVFAFTNATDFEAAKSSVRNSTVNSIDDNIASWKNTSNMDEIKAEEEVSYFILDWSTKDNQTLPTVITEGKISFQANDSDQEYLSSLENKVVLNPTDDTLESIITAWNLVNPQLEITDVNLIPNLSSSNTRILVAKKDNISWMGGVIVTITLN